MPKLKMSEKVKSRVKSSDSCYSAIPPGLSIRIGVSPQYQLGANIQLCAVRRITPTIGGLFAPEGALQRGDD